jgi:hypothetical protein
MILTLFPLLLKRFPLPIGAHSVLQKYSGATVVALTKCRVTLIETKERRAPNDRARSKKHPKAASENKNKTVGGSKFSFMLLFPSFLLTILLVQ